LGALLESTGQKLDQVIELRVNDNALVNRIAGRSTCGSCGEVYHDETKPQPADGKCIKCGSSDFKRRADDNEESLRNRLMEYYKKTSPLLGYYYAHDLLKRVDGLADIKVVQASIAAILDA
jgi:adenylate kinase